MFPPKTGVGFESEEIFVGYLYSGPKVSSAENAVISLFSEAGMKSLLLSREKKTLLSSESISHPQIPGKSTIKSLRSF